MSGRLADQPVSAGKGTVRGAQHSGPNRHPGGVIGMRDRGRAVVVYIGTALARFRREVDDTTTVGTTGLLVVWALLVGVAPEQIGTTLVGLELQVLDLGAVVYAVPLGLVILAIIAVSVGPWGQTVLGQGGATPDFDDLTYFAMLFAGGIAAGLVLFGPAEPLVFLNDPPPGVAGDAAPDRRVVATVGYAWLRWGILAWCTYAAFTIPVAYYCYRRGAPFRPSTVLYPLVRDRPRTRAAFDVGTLFVVITAVVVPVWQVSLNFIAGIEFQWGVTIPTVGFGLFVLAIALVVLVSAVTGLFRGIRRLSLVATGGLVLVTLLTLVFGPTRAVATLSLDAVLAHPSHAESLLDSVTSEWVTRVTMVTWAAWFGWAPVMGLFVARISRGRTIREVVGYSVLAAGVATMIWFGVVGGAVAQVHIRGSANVLQAISVVGEGVAVYPVFLTFPAGQLALLVFLGVGLLAVITTADSATFAVAMAASETGSVPDRIVRCYWAGVLTLLALVLGTAEAGSLNLLGGAAFAVVGAIGMLLATAAIIRTERT